MKEELKNIDDMFRSLHRAIQLNKSLLLLSRIQNRQFEEVTEVNMNPHVRKILELLSDLYEEKELDYHLVGHGRLPYPDERIAGSYFTDQSHQKCHHT